MPTDLADAAPDEELPPLPDPAQLQPLPDDDPNCMNAGHDSPGVAEDHYGLIGGGPTILFRGVDLSGYDARAGVNYKALYNAGYRFAWVKISEGTGFINTYAPSQLVGLIAAGFEVGGYHFGQPGDGAAQADVMYAAGRRWIGKGFLPPIADAEVSGVGVAYMSAFTARMIARSGVMPGSYSSRSFFQNDLAGGRGWERPGQLRWIAAYGGSGPGIACDVWQDSSSKQPPGTNRATDTDASYAPMAKLVVGAGGVQPAKDEGDSVIGTCVLADGAVAMLSIKNDGYPYLSLDRGKTWSGPISKAYTYAAGASCASFRGGMLAVVRDNAHHWINLLHIPNPRTPADGWRVQSVGGTGAATVNIVIEADDTIFLTTKGVDTLGSAYTKTIHVDGSSIDWAQPAPAAPFRVK
jgi:GH25 family lysozyme M1 (1,4-beta-N-acetylmuramidase)